MSPDLPTPTRRRWQPLRAGVVDLFYYDAEEFWFRDGRLLLRGNNGTGKSKVLALTLPFLLDGDLSPHRVEPDADPKKRMEWNLLLGGAHPHPERLGYSWLEFGRLDDDDHPVFQVIGCGMKAVAGRGIARHWYFLTTRRPGAELALVDATGIALTRERLVDAIGDTGAVHDRARDYRRAVDEQLFGLGERRYGALVDLLIQLRQPQLSKRPSEKALSQALTEALPPIDQALVSDVAEAFRSLEEDREALRAMTEARDAATSFLGHYQRYARIASRRRAALPRNTQADHDRISKERAAADEAFERAETALAAARQRQEELETDRRTLEARREALRASPQMRDARALDQAAAEARRLAEEERRAVAEREEAARRVATHTERHRLATQRLREGRDRLAHSRGEATDAAGRGRIRAGHDERVDAALADPTDAAGPARSVDPTRLRREAEQLVERQQRALRHVTGLVEAAAEAARRLATARQALGDLDAQADALAARRAEAEEEFTDHGARLVTAYRRQLEGATELRLSDPATTLAALELWVETLDGADPAATAARAAAEVASAELVREDTRLAAEEERLGSLLAELAAEITRLERGEDDTPPVPHTRRPQLRHGRVGAPLWRLVDFTDDVTDASRAGIEAALEASGLLDAWVTPTGEALAAGTDDVVLVAGEPARRNLGAVLRAAVDPGDPGAAAVPEATIARLLATIGLAGSGEAWVDASGRFRLGPLEGSWRKESATYIGRGAREAARRARLASLRAAHEETTAERDGVAAARTRLAERGRRLAEELQRLPDHGPLLQAHNAVAALVREQQRLAGRHEAARTAVTAAVAAEEGARAALVEGAGDADLPADRGGLAEVAEALGHYRVAIATLASVAETVDEAAVRAGETATDFEHATGTLTDRAERAGELAQKAAAAAAYHGQLCDTVGAAVAELQQQLDEVERTLRATIAAGRQAANAVTSAAGDRGVAMGRQQELAEQLEEAATRRAEAAEAFRRFAGTGLLTVALPELELPDPDTPWAPHPTVRLARRVNDELAQVADGDEAWERAQQRVNVELKNLHDTLSRHGNRATAELREDGMVVQVQFQGRPAAVPELVQALVADVTDRERLLDEREREILENHLVNEVASTVQELITAAEAQVAAMNAELESRPTSTGMRLRLRWRPREDGPAGLAAARERLLRQTSDAWSEEDRAAVGSFLQQQIGQVRADNPAGNWLEHLTEALDYRGWNRFTIERHQNGQWRSATGPASGGERVLAASAPLFAAASAHYASAGNPHAPRLVTLDEAFAGVDDNARAKYFGLLAAFDLDVVMTSEREWGCYPQVPGLAISQLSRVDDVAAVLVTNWEWDGSTRSAADRPVNRLAAPAAAPPEPVP